MRVKKRSLSDTSLRKFAAIESVNIGRLSSNSADVMATYCASSSQTSQ